MVDTGPKNRRRQWHSKTRNGCLTCKHRHIKCDEARPACLKCTSTHRKCDGYAPPQTWLFEPQNTSSSISPSLNSDHSPPEHRALLYFHEKTAPMLSAWTSFTQNFFTTVIPRMIESEAAIRHIVIAAVSRHELMDSPSSQVVQLSHLQGKHYAAALRELNQKVKRQADVLLMSSLWFFAFEEFEDSRKKTTGGLFHLISGLKILQQHFAAPMPGVDTDLIENFLYPMFIRLEWMLSMLMTPLDASATSATYAAAARKPALHEPQQPKLPARLHDLHEARRLFVGILRWRYRYEALTSDWTTQSKPFVETRDLMLAWQNLVMVYQDNLPPDSSHELNRVTAMMSQYHAMLSALTYSARKDLWAEDCLRPITIDLSQQNTLSATYVVPSRPLKSLASLAEEEKTIPDPMEIRLWPVGQFVGMVGDCGIYRLVLSL